MDDIARQLPEPPPPRPAARTATIAAAMAKFDGVEVSASPTPVRAPRWQISRGPAAALASVIVVALIGIPLALLKPNDQVAGPVAQVRQEQAPAAIAPTTPAARPPVAASDTAGVAPSPQRRAQMPSEAADTAVADVPAAPIVSAPPAPAPAPAPEPAAPPPPPPPPAALAAVPQAKVAPEAQMSRYAARSADANEIVVTGSRVSRSTPRGEWNACTVDDPARDPRKCGSTRRARDIAGGAALSEGLIKGWQSDWTAAVAAFDRVIATEPKRGEAYLNRGLAQWRAGDVAAALSDLDRAVRYAPDARSYYNRARVRRANGDVRGARADEARALEIDPNYAAAIEN